MFDKEEVTRIPVVLYGQFHKDYLEENIHEEILQGQFIPIPDDTPIKPADYVELTRYGFEKRTVFVCSVLMMVFGLIEFLANGLLLAFNSAIYFVGGGFICAVFLTTAGALGIAAARTLEDCPIGGTMVLTTFIPLTCIGQVGVTSIGVMSDFLGNTAFGATAVTNPTTAMALHVCNGLAGFVGLACSITVAALSCQAMCCAAKRFEYRELMHYKMKSKKPKIISDEFAEYDQRSSWPNKQHVEAEQRSPKKDIMSMILGGYDKHKVGPDPWATR